MIQICREPLDSGVYFCLCNLSLLELQSLGSAQHRADCVGVTHPTVLAMDLDHLLPVRPHTGGPVVGLLHCSEPLSVTEI